MLRRSLLAALATISTPALAQRNGDLIAADPVAQAPEGMRAWRIRYWTSDDRGGPREVTGMVVAPRGERGATPAGYCLDPRDLGCRAAVCAFAIIAVLRFDSGA